MKGALSTSETSILTRATWRNIPEEAIVLSTSSLGSLWLASPWKVVTHGPLPLHPYMWLHRLCGLVVKPRGSGFNSRRYRTF
jgi:hypothetical protein